MRILSLFIIGFFTIISFAQENNVATEKGIILTKKDSTQTSFLKEHKRIKVKLLNGKVFVGKFTIVDDKTINIRENIISLDSISKIKRRSVVAAIMSPIIIYYGSVFIGLGILFLASQTYSELGIAFSAIGAPLILIPSISEKHWSSKWKYSIGENPKIKIIKTD